jgi:hypothetical protein
MRFLTLGALAILLVSCGPRSPGAKPGETLYWRVTSSDVSYASCTDDPQFRTIEPIGFDENTYFIYRVERDGKKATALTCQSFDSASCVPHSSGLAFDVAGTELLYAREGKSAIGQNGCMLLDSQSWVLTDHGVAMDMEVSHILSLVDAQEACDQVEETIKAQSPNGLGVRGCIVRFTLGLTLD